ncbi:aldo/keto reductase [Sandaracinus amylolyticus]|uniref:aldo/keto reductase n=1 Tax=Sandaracinus amylolyticus TaxID=927083 RepID=UPI001F44EB5F|nr:aldo/keto reductase [Sandaracinus amylolyticus]UJR78965.1 Methylglyoxal reductase [Sandaracinus amylolyticus]
MEQRALGPGDLRVSVVTFGAMGFGEPGPDEDARRAAILRAALEAGVTAIDTAPLYGFGRSERVIGKVIAELRPRPKVLTKVGLRWDCPSQHGEPLFQTVGEQGQPLVVRRDSRPESVLLEIERSLERLGVERLDLVQVHQRDRRVPIRETFGALRDAVRAGAVAHVGVSNFTGREVEEARAALGDVPLASLQSPLSLLAREVERDGLVAARRVGAGFLAYSPLAQGLLAGTYGPHREVQDWRAGSPLFAPKVRELIQDVIRDVLQPIATRHGATPGQVSLAWVLARPGVSAVIAGASSEAQARQNAGASALRLEPREVTDLESAFARVTAAAQRHAKMDGVMRRARSVAGAVKRRVMPAGS